MKVLLLHDIAPDDLVAARLRAEDHTVVWCRPPAGARQFPCVGLEGRCPLDGTVDAAVVVHDRPTPDFSGGEVGAVCATRDGIPVVLAGNGSHTPLREVAAAVAVGIEDVAAACTRSVQARQRRLGREVGAEVRIHGGRVRAVLPAGATAADTARVQRRLAAAVPTARSIDIAVEGIVAGRAPGLGPGRS